MNEPQQILDYRDAKLHVFDGDVHAHEASAQRRFLVKIIEPDGKDRGLTGDDLDEVLQAIRHNIDARRDTPPAAPEKQATQVNIGYSPRGPGYKDDLDDVPSAGQKLARNRYFERAREFPETIEAKKAIERGREFLGKESSAPSCAAIDHLAAQILQRTTADPVVRGNFIRWIRSAL